MHLLRTELRSLDETAVAVDLQQTRADIVALSFTDSDLAVLAKGWERLTDAPAAAGLTLRLASLNDLRHPYSVDLYVEKVIAHARFIFIRLLGGLDYWKYGIEEVARIARDNGAQLAIIAGDDRDDPRLERSSTTAPEDLRRLWLWMQSGGAENAEQCLRYAASQLGRDVVVSKPRETARIGVLEAAHRSAAEGSPSALMVFYRSAWLAGDTAPYEALADALAEQKFEVRALYVTSLKDSEVVAELREALLASPPDVILNSTSFSARLDDGSDTFDVCDAPVLQAGVSLATLDQWQASSRGLAPADLAMNIALPEVDGRIHGATIAFKAEQARIGSLEYAPHRQRPQPENIEHVARLAAAWARLRREPKAQKRIAFVLSDYPAKGGRAGYAVGLDTFASVAEMARRLSADGYELGDIPQAPEIATRLSGSTETAISVGDYVAALRGMPEEFVRSVEQRWGAPEDDAACEEGQFRFAYLRLGDSLVALQPDRGPAGSRKGDYHDFTLAPRHAYVAFYLWLRERERVHAIVHVGAHGSLEWLPGKAVALSSDCAPRAVLGPVPLIYPFIVNNPGEAAQAKRRASAVILGHLTPPLVKAGSHGAAAELEGLMDEYAEAQTLDPRRARRIAELVIERARESGLAEEAGLYDDISLDDALTRLDAWLCDLKDMRIGDGLHVFGKPPAPALRAETAETIAAASSENAGRIEELIDLCAEAEMEGLLNALSGRRVAPGPGGAPARGRLDVLPTGRNLYSIDPRSVPTRTAWELGVRASQELLARYAQDHGEWPKQIVFDLWGSATMRTGGEDLAQAMALIGVRPIWDGASHRVSGFEVLSIAALGRPRVDVTLRISGLFRDVFPSQTALFQAAASAVAARVDEDANDNPLAEAARGTGSAARVFGAAPGAYGTGIGRKALGGDWSTQADLGDAYLAATSHAYEGDGARASGEFKQRVSQSQAFVHVQDAPGQDVLDSDAFAEHEGGFAAAATAAGAHPEIYHFDATDPKSPKLRTLKQEIARSLRGRALHPRWLEGQMRHGFRGAAEIAETVDNFYLFAATTEFVEDTQFDALFDAVCADARVRDFLREANPQAAAAIAARFEDALSRGLWATRRNSVGPTLDALRGAP